MSNRITGVLVLTLSIMIITIGLSGCAKPAEAPRAEEPSPYRTPSRWQILPDIVHSSHEDIQTGKRANGGPGPWCPER